MKVVHINTFDQLGGAARAAHRLHTGLRRIGVESSMFVAEKHGTDDSIVIYNPPTDPLSRLRREIRRRSLSRDIGRYRETAPGGLSFFTDDRSVFGKDPWEHLPQNDVIQVHWIFGFLDYRDFFSSVGRGKPVVWTMHGMDPITGGCAYDLGCGRFQAECGACPQLGSKSETDLTRAVWKRKRKAYAELKAGQLHIVTPSRWLRDEVKRSSLLSGCDCTVIPNGLDIEAFAPRDRSAAREVLGIPGDAKVILFVADGLQDPRKGFRFLAQALEGMRTERQLFLLSLGPGKLPETDTIPGLRLGSIDNDRFLSIVYSAADIFVAPSVQDNLPNTIVESMACGTPVVGFDVGGIPDMIKPRLTGSLAKPQDSTDLGRAIVELLSDAERRKAMGANCRKIACEEFSMEVQAKRYEAVYREMLERNRS